MACIYPKCDNKLEKCFCKQQAEDWHRRRDEARKKKAPSTKDPK